MKLLKQTVRDTLIAFGIGLPGVIGISLLMTGNWIGSIGVAATVLLVGLFARLTA